MIPPRRAALRIVRTLLAGACVSLVSRAAEPDTPRATNDELVLFVGLDVMVTHASAEGRIEDYRRRSILLETTRGPATIATRDVKGIRAQRDPKITSDQVAITELKSERAYSPATDPEMQAIQQQGALLAHQSELQDRVDRAQRALADAAHSASRLPTQQRDTAMAEAQQQADSTLDDARIADIDPADIRGSMLGAADAFDTLHVTFTVSSPSEIHGAYVLLLTTIQAPASPSSFHRFTLSELPLLTREPRKVRLSQYGLPPGFTVLSSEVHIYAAGREYASNLSANRTPISRSEAHTFLTLQREIKHRDEDVPAEVARALLAPGIRQAIPPDQVHRSAKVGINSDGAVTSVSLDTGGSPEIDAPIEAAIRATLFFPTLEKGRPIASTLTFNLSELVP